MYCPKCNRENQEGATFCENCGTRLDSVADNNSFNQSVGESNSPNQTYEQPNYVQQPNYAQQPNYIQQPNYVQQPNYAQKPNYAQQPVTPVQQDEHMSVGAWVGVFCINLIPCVGSLVYIIMMFVWAFGNTPKKSLKTFAKAQLLMFAIVLVIVAIVYAIILATGMSMVDSYRSYYYN